MFGRKFVLELAFYVNIVAFAAVFVVKLHNTPTVMLIFNAQYFFCLKMVMEIAFKIVN